MSPDLNMSIMYRLYKDSCDDPVSLFMFRQVFTRNFNISFHPQLSDTCKKCDAFNIRLQVSSGSELQDVKQHKEIHLRKAEGARHGIKSDAELGTSENDVTVIAFDLMKTLPTPVLSVGNSYYKRQLWKYCLGIHNLNNNDAFMYIWNESMASRGPQNIGSCVLHCVQSFVSIKKLIM